ncbi:hypothetical protein Q8F55_001733 [Vanrija albida]|uniref:Gamma-glutamyltransferase n=1 Tax=Vanrija albida TaxID=181172 RepID=A0ABR3Q8N2_9TREE
MPLDYSKLNPANDTHFAPFASRRSTVYSTKGMVATSQPLAAQAGLEILNKGGNAADAAVATAAALNVTEPTCTGIGGDLFCLFYDAKSKTVRGINASGRAPKALTLEYLRQQGVTGDKIPLDNLNSVTVPGAASGWELTVKEFGSGKLTLAEVLEPAIRLAKDGVPSHEINSRQWAGGEKLVKKTSPNWREMMLPDGTPPKQSNIMKHPELARTFEAIAEHGAKGFYTGRIAEEIVKLIQSAGGVMTLEDLAEHTAEVVEPLNYTFKATADDPGLTLWECPPNGQGLTALLALGIIEAVERVHGVDVLKLEHNSTEYLHVLIEALRLSFADTQYYVTDPAFEYVPVKELLSKEYLDKRAALIDLTKSGNPKHGHPVSSSDTVYLTTADKEGNACSFIASNYAGFGTGAIPAGCGFTLQNRGSGFTLREGHPNNVAGGKRPYHTIIPAMVTHGDELVLSYGVMGGFMQPQGHVQVLLNLLRGYAPQSSLDAPRFCISAGLPDAGTANAAAAGDVNSEIWVEEGVAPEVLDALRALGHDIKLAAGYNRKIAGKGQVILAVRDPSGANVWAGGSDLRGDGAAVGQI